MKRIILFLLVICFFTAYSQEKYPIETEYEGSPTTSLFRKNEIRLNAVYLITKGLEIGYERIINDDVSVGISSLLFSYERNYEGLNFHCSPYARYYFGKKPSSGFFLEGFASVFNKNYLKSDQETYYKSDSRTSVAFGFSIGKKWVKRSGFTLELSGGVGREPRSTQREYAPFIFKGEFSLGYRF